MCHPHLPLAKRLTTPLTLLLLGVLFIFGTVPKAFAQTQPTITVAILVTPNQRELYHEIFARFTDETGIGIKVEARTDREYKRKLPVWLYASNDTPDVMLWQASQRLFVHVNNDAILPITDIWQELSLDASLGHVKSGVSIGEEVYGLPISYYHWGLYYRPELIEQYGQPPGTWREFIDIADALRKDGIAPVGLGNKNQWPAAAWFDYLNLRVNGLHFHQQLLAGDVPFTDDRVRQVLVHWKKMVVRGFFNDDHASLSWDQVVPKLYREKVGFVLIGSFVTTKFNAEMGGDISFLPFPKIEAIPHYEVAPTEIMMIPKRARHIPQAKMFIRFMARAEVQEQLNNMLGYLPPHRESKPGIDYFTQQGAALLSLAAGVSQYFDRDTVPAFEKKALPIFAQFLKSGDIDRTLKTLEKLRQDVYLNDDSDLDLD
ncbi:ABC transporter substrate-binding protein [Corallincola platygyrae]|uniref:ABC transporter substrate-binding protein n=1 Tax=Corallincola platygyrae TaxID=1193278 RepID=A0ABW4XK82_9GAMM